MKLDSKLNGNMNYRTLIHRFEYSVLYRLKDKTRIERAMAIQDKIRGQIRGGINLTKEIRKWRDVRCS